jgi:hypothetical protein
MCGECGKPVLKQSNETEDFGIAKDHSTLQAVHLRETIDWQGELP